MSNSAPRVLFFGRDCALSLLPLASLLASGARVTAVVSPARRPDARSPLHRVEPSRLTPGDGLAGLAGRAGIPILEVAGLRHPSVRGALLQQRADVLVASCFPFLVPGGLRRAAALGGINVHPSLLPRHRGPDPLFWTFRHHEDRAGVSIHALSGRLDTGALLAQEPVAVPPGIEGNALERTLAERAAAMLPPVLAGLATGATSAVEQEESESSYEGWPEEADLELRRDWTAEHAWSFVRGVAPLGYRTWIRWAGRTLWLDKALELRPNEWSSSDEREGPRLQAGFRGGQVVVQLSGA